jgi:hypothetical protein
VQCNVNTAAERRKAKRAPRVDETGDILKRALFGAGNFVGGASALLTFICVLFCITP